MDPVHGPLHGTGPWTTPGHPSFCEKIFKREKEEVLALTWTISAIFSHRHLKNSGGTHDPCDVRTVGRTGQSVGLVCSGEGPAERNECILHLKFEVRVILDITKTESNNCFIMHCPKKNGHDSEWNW